MFLYYFVGHWWSQIFRDQNKTRTSGHPRQTPGGSQGDRSSSNALMIGNCGDGYNSPGDGSSSVPVSIVH